jgi:hypothetical protein
MSKTVQTEHLLLVNVGGKSTVIELYNTQAQKTFAIFPDGCKYELKNWENNTIELKGYPQKPEIME